MRQPPGPRDRPAFNALGLVGVGLELMVAVVLLLAAGRWLDVRWGTEPWLMLLGAALGMAVGFYGLFRRLLPRGGRNGKAS